MTSLVKIKLTKPQYRLVNSSKTFPAFVGGYGSGKTEGAIWRILRLKFAYPKLNSAYYLPTYDLVNLIAVPRIEEILQLVEVPYKTNKSEKFIELENCGKIIFRTMDKPERIIGYEVADSIADEIDILTPEKAADVWARIIARNRQKKHDDAPNTAAVCTTPEGFKFIYKNWYLKPFPNSELIRASTYSNGKNLAKGYINNLKSIYSTAMLSAYLDGKFVNFAYGCVYPNFDRKKNSCLLKWDNKETLHIGMDFNVNHMAAATHILREGIPYAIDELIDYLDTPTMIRAIKSRYWPQGKSCDIIIYPDATGKSGHSVNASKSDIGLLNEAGFTVLGNKSNPYIKDRVISFNYKICNNEKREYFVNIDKCPHLVEALEKQAYDKNNEPDKSSGLDHIIDAAGYFITYRFPIIRNQVTKFKLKGF